ncbi:MAG: nucleotidyl transferase AbiEii/AbiGii toxin family protein, partial [Spirochaetales bacterium]|nr:nucleotidyl transferase AbiEii/AbiGii toxin family protein [Spirochaetales bacterium]
MISKDYITAWRTYAPWVSDHQVEQDLVICRTIIEIFKVETLNQRLAFRGGTALYKLFLHPAARYSEDIDLVQITPEPIGNT